MHNTRSCAPPTCMIHWRETGCQSTDNEFCSAFSSNAIADENIELVITIYTSRQFMRKTHSSVHSTVSYYAFRIANPDFGSTRQEAMLPNHLRRSSLTLDIHTWLYRLIVVLVPEQSCIGFLFTFRTFLIGNSFNALFRLRVERCDSHSIGITNEWKHVVVDVVSQSFRHCLAVLTNVPARHDRVRRNSAFVFYIPRVAIHDSRWNCICGIASTRASASQIFPWCRQRTQLYSLYLFRSPANRRACLSSKTGTSYDSTLRITFTNSWLRLSSISYTRVASIPE